MSAIRRHYPAAACPICGQPVTTGGAGKVKHLRAHIARGEAQQTDGEATSREHGFRTTYAHTPAFEFFIEGVTNA
jgi:hypothetical protein